MQYYFKRFSVLHSSEVVISFLIKKARQKAIEIETAFFTRSQNNPNIHYFGILVYNIHTI